MHSKFGKVWDEEDMTCFKAVLHEVITCTTIILKSKYIAVQPTFNPEICQVNSTT